MNRFTFTLMIVAGGLGIALTMGCAETKAPHAGRTDSVTAAQYPQISVQDDLHWQLVFDKPIVKSSDDRPMSVSVPVRVAKDSGIAIQYRFDFLDESGRPVPPEMQWRYAQLPARNQRFLEGAALDTAAVDWRFEVRRAR